MPKVTFQLHQQWSTPQIRSSLKKPRRCLRRHALTARSIIVTVCWGLSGECAGSSECSSACSLTGARKFNHIPTMLRELYWRSVRIQWRRSSGLEPGSSITSQRCCVNFTGDLFAYNGDGHLGWNPLPSATSRLWSQTYDRSWRYQE